VGATDYVWDFGDGVTSTLLIEVHAFWPPDTYHVTLRVSGPGGIDTDTVDVQVPC
jgi:PKD repeat protein